MRLIGWVPRGPSSARASTSLGLSGMAGWGSYIYIYIYILSNLWQTDIYLCSTNDTFFLLKILHDKF
jgi:hypothetical protein